jgi:hypothetical protein
MVAADAVRLLVKPKPASSSGRSEKDGKTDTASALLLIKIPEDAYFRPPTLLSF